MNWPIPDGMVLCGHCNGYGSSLREDAPTCTRCGGSGLVPITFDCPNCGQIAVTKDEPCPDAALARLHHDLALAPARHDRRHLHPDYVRGCAACQYRDQLKAGIA